MDHTNHDRQRERLYFFDTTLRDGEQSPGCSMTREEKLSLAHALAELGVDILEAGFAVSSDGDFDSIATIAKEVRGPRIASLARARKQDIELAARSVESAERSRIHVFLATSDLHLQYKLKISREEALSQAGESVRLARTYADDVEFSPEDATRSDHQFLCQMVTVAVEAGATTINVPDTVGYTTPEEYGNIFRMLRERVPGADKVIFSSHCHDDLGLAVANSLAAIEAGVRQVECTINGIGERAGNAALEEIAAALHVRADRYPVESNIVLDRLYPVSQLLGSIISFKPSPNKAVVGSNAFAHEAGIHQHGVLSNPLTYEIMTPESVGVPGNRMVLGKHSGRRALVHRLAQLGYDLAPADLDIAYVAFTELADRKKAVYDQDLINLVSHHRRHHDLVANDLILPICTAAEASEKVPSGSGYYTIFIDDAYSLPSPFRDVLLERDTNLIYMGIAEGSLRERLLKQDLLHQQPSTFFRAIGPILGHRPIPGSLVGMANQNNYKFDAKTTLEICSWIRKHLSVSWLEANPALAEFERTHIKEFCPLLNTKHNPKALPELASLRAECRDIAKRLPSSKEMQSA